MEVASLISSLDDNRSNNWHPWPLTIPYFSTRRSKNRYRRSVASQTSSLSLGPLPSSSSSSSSSSKCAYPPCGGGKSRIGRSGNSKPLVSASTSFSSTSPPPTPRSQHPTPHHNTGIGPPPPTRMSHEEWLREVEHREFYKNYNAMDGVVTAVVLGGFFAFVCLLVVYKTKCKPMWKNRRKRLTNTPATQSMADVDSCGNNGLSSSGGGGASRTGIANEAGSTIGSTGPPPIPPPPPIIQVPGGPNSITDLECVDGIEHPTLLSLPSEEYGFECIPLQSVNDDDDDDDIYYLDEFGNYVFPISTPTIPGSCSCPPSADDLNFTPRRNSQVNKRNINNDSTHNTPAVSDQVLQNMSEFCRFC